LSLAPVPNFFIIGARRSATRWLRFNLDLHPEITIPPLLPPFVDPGREGSLDSRWYRHQYDPYFGEPLVGEARSAYMSRNHPPLEYARRLKRSRPDAKLIAILRDPVDRFWSAVAEEVVRGDMAAPIPDRSTNYALARHVSGGYYYGTLEPFVERFGDQLLVLFYEDICADPADVYARVLGHLGVDPTFRPADLAKVRYPGRVTHDYVVTPEYRASLFDWYTEDVAQLEEWTGRDLSHWRPVAAEEN
jgi:Sulfotransferase family